MHEHLKALKSNKAIEVPNYDFATHSRLPNKKTQSPKPIILVDGILILCHPKLRDVFDEIIFVSAPEDVRFQRRLDRDVAERGRTPEGVKNQFDQQVKPMHDEFVEPSKKYASRVSSGTDMKDLQDLSLIHISEPTRPY